MAVYLASLLVSTFDFCVFFFVTFVSLIHFFVRSLTLFVLLVHDIFEFFSLLLANNHMNVLPGVLV